jgi:DNA-binding MarR family transcriptional regulator
MIARKPELCNCLALRQAARHVTQFYDQFLAETGLRTTQFSMLAYLRRLGPVTINTLADRLVMDRTTLGRNLQPLERAGLIAVVKAKTDGRRRELHLTPIGRATLRAATQNWTDAQRAFDRLFGRRRARALRAMMRDVATTTLTAAGAPE